MLNPFHRDDSSYSEKSIAQFNETEDDDLLDDSDTHTIVDSEVVRLSVSVQSGEEIIEDLYDEINSHELTQDSCFPEVVSTYNIDCLSVKHNYEETIRALMVRADGNWLCKVCGKEYTSKNKTSLKDHIEVHHTGGFEFDCHICGKKLPSRASFSGHKARYH